MHLPPRHRTLLPPKPETTQQNRDQRRALEDHRKRFGEDPVAKSAVWFRRVLQAIELRDEDAYHAQDDGGTEVAEEGAFVGCRVKLAVRRGW